MMFGGGGNLTFKWLTGILISLVLTLTALWAGNLTTQMNIIGKKVDAQAASISKIEGQLPQMADRLKRIEDNQDRVRRP